MSVEFTHEEINRIIGEALSLVPAVPDMGSLRERLLGIGKIPDRVRIGGNNVVEEKKNSQ